MKFLVTDCKTSEEKEKLREMGLFCYDLRDSDFGRDIASIEKRVLVNRIGSMITNEEIKLGDKYPDDFVDYNTFVSQNEGVNTINELLNKTKERSKNNAR